MNIGDRLRKIRKDKGLDQGDFANFLNISQQNLSNYETNKRDIPEQIKIKLQQNGVNLNWLISGDGEPFIKNAEEPKKSALIQEIENTAVEAIAPKFIEQDNRIKRIEEELKDLRSLYEQKFKNEPPQPDSISEPAPLYTADYEEPEETEELPLAVNLAAGVPVEAADSGETYPVPKRFIKQNKKYCVAKINGTSMTEADIPDGSSVLLEYTDQPVNGKNMVVKYGSNTTLKLLHQTETGSWELLYCDGSGAKIELKDGDWEVKGKFITVLPKKR